MDIRKWLRISIAFGAANIKRWDYIDINNAEGSLEDLLSNTSLQNDPYLRKYRSITDDQLNSIIDMCDRHRIDIVTPDDKDYPYDLRFISNPPAVLFVLGDLSHLSRCAGTAIVGARDCSEYSSAVAYRFALSLGADKVNIISGLASGIDSAAHTGALDGGGVTTAVLGSGILYDYPKGSMPLKKRIATRGAVISEYLPTARPARENFKIRNRMITGLSDCILVVEAGEKSGALNSANHAAEQGKEVFVIPPHDLYDPAYKGQTGLLADGARLALSPDDILEYIAEYYKWL